MRFYWLEDWLGRQLDRVPWRWVLLALAVALAAGKLGSWAGWWR